MTKVSIRPAALRDASWICANLRAMDHREAMCQMPDGLQTHALAWMLINAGPAFIAYLGDEPGMLFGTSLINVCTCALWALGTKKTMRVVPAVTRFMLTEHCAALVDAGVTSMEARSLEMHRTAHAWMKSTGAIQWGEPFEYGKGGERFILFRWTVAGYRSITQQKWRRP